MKQKIFIGADSAGYALKSELITYLGESGYEVVDCGTDSDASCGQLRRSQQKQGDQA